MGLLFFAAVLACYASPIPTASTDQVPTGNWTYDAFIHLAAKGFVPGMSAQRFEGDWRYTREDMARFVLSTASSSIACGLDDSDRALLSRLAAEYGPEIRVIAGDAAFESLNPYAKADKTAAAGYFDGRYERQSGENHLIGVYDAAGFGLPGKYVTVAVTTTDRRRKFEGDAFPVLDTYFVRGKTPNWEWEIGRDYMWWGPGYSGSMILSDNSPSFPLLKLAKDFYFGPHIGNVKITQFVSAFDDNGKAAYLVGRRWEKRFSPSFHMGVNETAKTTKAPNPTIFILPALYLYEHIYLNDIDAEWNSLISIDATYETPKGLQGYADFLIDDMKAPAGLRTGPAWDLPRKVGLLVGAYHPNIIGDGKTGFRAEYIFTDAGTYGATRPDFPQLAYTHDNFIIGHPVGGNSSAVFLRLDSRFAPKWAGIVQYLGRVPKESNGPNPNNEHQFGVLLSYDIAPDFSLTARYDSITFPQQGGNRLQFGASYAF